MRAIVLHAVLHPESPRRWETALLQRLPYAKRLQLEALDAASRRASLAGIALVLAGSMQLTGRHTSVDALSFPLDGKPSASVGPGFSITHAGSIACCVLAESHDIGVDLEWLPAGADAVTERKLLRWTALEATLKASGRGLRDAGEIELADDLSTGSAAGRQFLLQRVALDTAGVAICHVAAPVPLQVEVASVDLAGADISATLQRCLGLGP